MYYYLSNEVKLDVFKYLNFDQLLSVRQTNRFFCSLIGRYEDELARKEFRSFLITNYCGDNYPLIELKNGVFDFSLSSQLLEKWNSAISKQISIYSDVSIMSICNLFSISEIIGGMAVFLGSKDKNNEKKKEFILKLPGNNDRVGFAFWFCFEIIAMFIHGINDIRNFWNPENVASSSQELLQPVSPNDLEFEISLPEGANFSPSILEHAEGSDEN
ncbi:hypothetical protein ACQ4LE_006171 [Meloidogyne hapla]